MTSRSTKILEFNQSHKYDKAPFVLYANFKFLIRKIDGCQDNPGKLPTMKLGENILSAFSISGMSSFKSVENNHDVYLGKNCIEKVFESLREHAINIINFEKKKMKLLTNE